eukprot:6204186-Pleurochrysis_carterae.AAC.1
MTAGAGTKGPLVPPGGFSLGLRGLVNKEHKEDRKSARRREVRQRKAKPDLVENCRVAHQLVAGHIYKMARISAAAESTYCLAGLNSKMRRAISVAADMLTLIVSASYW